VTWPLNPSVNRTACKRRSRSGGRLPQTLGMGRTVCELALILVIVAIAAVALAVAAKVKSGLGSEQDEWPFYAKTTLCP